MQCRKGEVFYKLKCKVNTIIFSVEALEAVLVIFSFGNILQSFEYFLSHVVTFRSDDTKFGK